MTGVIIEQTEDQAKNSFALHSNAEFVELRLIEARLRGTLTWDEAKVPIEFLVRSKPVGTEVREGALFLDLLFTFEARDSSEKKLEVGRLECTFRAKYRLRPEYKPSAEQIADFHSGNAIFNCWPYFREYTQSCCVRMGFPPPPVPFLRLVRGPSSAPPTAAVERAESPKEQIEEPSDGKAGASSLRAATRARKAKALRALRAKPKARPQVKQDAAKPQGQEGRSRKA